jgi:hypothetical protein
MAESNLLVSKCDANIHILILRMMFFPIKVSLNPQNTLTFKLERGQQPKTVWNNPFATLPAKLKVLVFNIIDITSHKYLPK